jgi:hypothetical protein
MQPSGAVPLSPMTNDRSNVFIGWRKCLVDLCIWRVTIEKRMRKMIKSIIILIDHCQCWTPVAGSVHVFGYWPGAVCRSRGKAGLTVTRPNFSNDYEEIELEAPVILSRSNSG